MPSDYDPEMLSVGMLGRPHGVGGEIVLRPHNRQSRTLDAIRSLLVVKADGQHQRFDVAAVRSVAGGYLVRLVGVTDREAAAALTLGEVRVPRAVLPPLGPGEFYVEDVVGCAVENEDGHSLGVARETFWNGAHDVLAVDGPDGRERLIPLVPDFVLDVDPSGRKLRVRWSDDD
jgi:16S rRNA processing protein RimM